MPNQISTKGGVVAADEIKPKDDVVVYGTGKSTHMPDGQEFTVHSHVAKILVEQGKATMEPQKAKNAKKD